MNRLQSHNRCTFNATRDQRGFTVLIASLVGAVVLAIGLSILAITLKQIKLSGLVKESETAFQAAHAGNECIQYWDHSTTNGGRFDVGTTSQTIRCFGIDQSTISGPISGEEQRYDWTWGSPTSVCSSVSIYKFYDAVATQTVAINGVTYRSGCPPGIECTVVKTRGYNAACNALTGNQIVERELTIVY